MTPADAAGSDPVSSSLPPLAGPTVSMEILRQHQAGEPRALEQLWRRYLPRVRRVAAIQLGESLARWLDEDDVVQETFRQTVDALASFEPRDEASLLRLFSQRVQFVIRDAAKQRTRRKRDVRREQRLDPLGSAAHPAEASPSPSMEASRREQAARIDAAVAALEPAQRDVFVHRIFLESPWAQLCEDLGLSSRGQAERLLVKARAALAARLSPGDGEG